LIPLNDVFKASYHKIMILVSYCVGLIVLLYNLY
jgi:hypothetical protein